MICCHFFIQCVLFTEIVNEGATTESPESSDAPEIPNEPDPSPPVNPAMVVLAEEATERERDKEGCGLTNSLQAIIYHYIALPVVKFRWVMFGMCFSDTVSTFILFLFFSQSLNKYTRT